MRRRPTALLGLSVVLASLAVTCPKRANLFPPAIAAGGGHSCRITAAGQVECWGMNAYGQLGKGTTGTTMPVAGATLPLGATAIAIATGNNHTCAVLTGGAVKCWGQNQQGQLGNNSTANSPTPVATGITNAKDIAAGGTHTCALLTTGAIQCWGTNQFGELGNGTNAPSNVPVNVSGITDGTSIAAGLGHTCAIRSGGAISCWGAGPIGSATGSNVPVAVAGISGATIVITGLTHTCAVLGGGAVSCWGTGGNGELGDGTLTSRTGPGSVPGLSGVTAIAAGGSHTCAVAAQGEVFCWGSNLSGQLGFQSAAGVTCAPSSQPCEKSPAKIGGIVGAIDVAAGDSHTCALFPMSRVACWGWNGFGQLGDGRASAQMGVADQFSEPHPVFVTRKALAVDGGTFGGSHACALLPDGTARCWGANLNSELGSGVLGTGTNPGSATPVQVIGLTNISQIAAGGAHTCALLQDVTMRCWGTQVFGQLGTPSSDIDIPTPLQGNSVSPVVGLGLGRQTTCVIKSGFAAGGINRLFCWGVNNNRQLGSPMVQPQCGTQVTLPCTHVPVQAQVDNVVWVGGGTEHGCALLADGRVACYGQNLFAQAGGNPSAGTVIVMVSGITRAVALAVGSNHNCALIAGGTVQCWGKNLSGQLGNGTTTGQNATPAAVPSINSAVAIAAGGDFSCALLLNGTVTCWGDNGLGTLGAGSAPGAKTGTPVAVSGLSDVTMIATAGDAGVVCATVEDGSVFCWGANGLGELGSGTRGGTSSTPSQVTGLP